MANKKPIIKADANGLTPEQKAEQVARFFTQKREQYFQIILGNLIHSTPDVSVRELVDIAIDGADYAIEKLFPLPTAEKKEDAK